MEIKQLLTLITTKFRVLRSWLRFVGMSPTKLRNVDGYACVPSYLKISKIISGRVEAKRPMIITRKFYSIDQCITTDTVCLASVLVRILVYCYKTEELLFSNGKSLRLQFARIVPKYLGTRVSECQSARLIEYYYDQVALYSNVLQYKRILSKAQKSILGVYKSTEDQFFRSYINLTEIHFHRMPRWTIP